MNSGVCAVLLSKLANPLELTWNDQIQQICFPADADKVNILRLKLILTHDTVLWSEE